MKTRAVVIEWGMPIEGRETKALEEFMSSQQWWGDLKSRAKIEDFHSYGLLTGDLSQRSGLVILEGNDGQIDALVDTEDYRGRIARISGLVHHLKVNTVETGDRMGKRMQRYGTEVKKVLG